VQLSIASIHHGLRVISRRLALELLLSSVATVLAMMVFSHLSNPAPLRQGERQAAFEEAVAAGAGNAAIKAFMERAALSAAATGRRPELPAARIAVAASTEPESPPARIAVATLVEPEAAAVPRALIAALPRHPAGEPHVRAPRLAVAVPVLPPPRPVSVAVAAPAAAEGTYPFEHVMRLPAMIWDTASSAGAFVVDNVAAVGGQFDSVAQSLL
jgi:hypothetical protein